MAKLLYSMGEVTEMFDVNASLIRYWESKFDCIKPHKNKKGNRMFTPSDIENFKLIYHLVREKGMTLEGANKAMKRRSGNIKRDISILERLQNIRAMLVEVRESLGESDEVKYEAPIDAVNELINDVENSAKQAVVKSVTEKEETINTTATSIEEVLPQETTAEQTPTAEVKVETDTMEEVAAEVETETEEAETAPAPRRRGRPRKVVTVEEDVTTTPAEKPTLRKRGKTKKSDENKELFPFYEQSLF